MDVFDLAAKIRLDTNEYEKGLSDASGKTSSFASKLGSGIRSAVKTATVAIGAASTAITAFGKSAVSAGARFDKSMAQVAATMGMTVDQIGNLREFAQEMGRTTVFSATQAADALNYMALAGYDAETSMKMLPNVLNLAAAGNIDLARASDMVTDAQTALGLSLDDTNVLVDQMAKASSKSNTSVTQLGDAILTIGGTAQYMKGGINELNTVLGLMADNGIKGSEAGTHLRNMLLKLSAPTNDAAGLLEHYADILGHDLVFDKATGQMRAFEDIFQDLNKVLGNATDEEKMQAFSTLFNARDVASANALLNTTVDRWHELSDAIGDAEGASAKMAETQLDNLAGDVTLFKSALEGAQIVVSDVLTPALREFVQFGSSSLSKLTEAFKKDGLGGAMGALGNILSDAIKMLTKKLPTLIKAGGKLVSALASGLIDNIDVILEAGGEVIDYLIDSFAEGLPSILDKGADVIVKIADGITKGLPKILPAISKIVANLADGIERNMPKILEAGEKIFNGIISALKDTRSITSIIKTATKLVTSLVTALPQVIKGLLDAMPKVINNLMNAITENMPAIIRGLVSVVDAIIENAPAILKGLVENAGKIITAVLRGITENLPKLVEGATAMINKLAEFVKENASDIGKNVTSLITALVTAITDPEVLSDLLKAAVDIIAAIANGFKDIVTDERMWESVIFAANAIIDALLQGIVNIGTAIWEIGEYIFDQIMVGLGLKDPKTVGEKWGKSFLSGVGGAFKTGLLTADNYDEWYNRKKKYGSLKIGDSLETYRMSGKLAAGDRLATQTEINAGKYRILEGTDGQQFAIYDPLKGNKAVPSRKNLAYDAARQSELAAVSSLTGGNALKYQMAIEAVTGAAAGMASKGVAEAAARAMQNQFRDTLAIYGENGTPLNPSAYTQVTLQVDKQTFGKVTYQQNKMASAIRGKALVDVGLSY